MEGLHNIDKNIFDILTNQGSHDDCVFNLVQSDEIFKQKLLYNLFLDKDVKIDKKDKITKLLELFNFYYLDNNNYTKYNCETIAKNIIDKFLNDKHNSHYPKTLFNSL